MDSIPQGWKAIRFTDFTTLQRGKDLTKNQFKSGNIPVAGSNGMIGYHDEPFVKAPGVTVGRSGSCGKVNYYAVDFWAHNTSLYVRDFHGNNEQFASYLLEFLDLGRFHTGASVPTLDRNSFKELLLIVPEVGEQRRIAHVLATVQTAIEQQERLIKITRELKSALMHKLFTKGLRGKKQKETEIGLVPENWTATQIGNIAKLQSGGTPSRDNPKYWAGGTIPWIKTTEINYKVIETTQEFITEEGLNNSAAKILPQGTLLAAMYGQGITRGRVGILGLDAAANQACAAITPRNEKQILTWFLYYYMQFHYQNLRDLGHGANQRNLNMDLIKSFPLSYPEIEEQQCIVDLLSTFDKKLSFIEQKHDLLEELFRTLLHQLMTGQTRVNEIDLPGFT